MRVVFALPLPSDVRNALRAQPILPAVFGESRSSRAPGVLHSRQEGNESRPNGNPPLGE